MKKICLIVSIWALVAFVPCAARGQASARIVSLNGAASEILCALGLEDRIVGVDVTSDYPVSLKQKPQVGHNTNISAEGLLALHPGLVFATEGQLKPALSGQLADAGVKTVLLPPVVDPSGVEALLAQVAAAVHEETRGSALRDQFRCEMHSVSAPATGKKVLFIYARGAGTMLVSGTGTSIDAMIRLAGAQNAIQGFQDFKPLSAESLVAAAPDVILMFRSGLQSMGGVDGLLRVPGVAQTPAGRQRRIITMDGELLSGFGLRLPEAIRELHGKIASP